MRLDVFMFEKGLAESRSKASALIKGGSVKVNGKPEKAPAFSVGEDDIIEVDSSLCRYVSRGGLKLEGALEFFKIDVKGMKAVDIGASTGGFTDCLLKKGARTVYAVDSGSDQLSKTLLSDERVISLERFNARYLTDRDTDGKCDIAVCDLSFISQTLVLDAVTGVLAKGGIFVTLIKPQFEVGRERIGKGGIVRDERSRAFAIKKVLDAAAGYGLISRGYTESPIKGGDGNVEYLACFIYNGKINNREGEAYEGSNTPE